MKMEEAIAGLDWAGIEAQLDQEGYAVLPGLLSEAQVRELAGQAQLPLVADLRAAFYRRLAPVANRWAEVLGMPQRYPDTLDVSLARKGAAGSICPPSILSHLHEGDYQALHQHGEDDRAFPLQLVALLSEPGKDFTGGEFVMTEQRPRMQSRPMVLPLRKGDMAVITVARRPHRGARGWYRVSLKHAISRVRSGERVGVELLLSS